MIDACSSLACVLTAFDNKRKGTNFRGINFLRFGGKGLNA